MKKMLSVLLTLCLVVLLLPVGVMTASAAEYGYTISNGEATITTVANASGDMIIPSTLGGYPVTAIGRSAFSDRSRVTSITIPNSVTSIGYGAFHSCSSLTSITIPNSVTSIGSYAFYGCSSLTSITIPNDVTSIGATAFYGCSSLTSITIPNGVTSIENLTFSDCISLTSIIIPNSVTWIGERAFQRIDKLTDVWYFGSDQSDITIHGTGNGALRNATWHYISTCPGEHVYDNVCDTVCNICKSTRIAPHLYDNACDVDCNECGDIRTVPDHNYTLNGGYTCDGCGIGIVPAAPMVASKTNHSVTLVKTEGLEYSKDITTWQDSPVFDNLAFNTTYTFYQRVKASATAQESGISDGTIVIFKSAQVQLSVPMLIGFTDSTVMLTAVSGAEYSKDGVGWQSEPTFVDLMPGTTYAFYQRLAETTTHEAGDCSEALYLTTDKAVQTAVPSAPTLQSVTLNSITLVAVDGCEYSKNSRTWQASPTFADLDPATSYTFYQRYAESNTHYVGKASVGATFMTNKATVSVPSAPILLNKTYDTITLAACDGYEYSIGGSVWQTSPVFKDLSPKTNYIVYQRVAETDAHYASAASSALIIKTDAHPLFDDALDTNDVRYVLKSIVGLSPELTEDEIFYADFNEDGKVNSQDIRRMLWIISFES